MVLDHRGRLLAMEVGNTRPTLYLDLESVSDRARLTDPERYLAEHEDELGQSLLEAE